MDPPTRVARVVVVAGPSGSGKSRLAADLGLPVVRLDDFYRDGDDPGLPRITQGANAGLVDWDHPGSWDRAAAVAALAKLCRDGAVEVPVYDLGSSSRRGSRALDLNGAPLVMAEGIFAPEVVAPLRSAGLLADALCLRQHRIVTFWRRLTRDLRERRKPPLVLLRRGLALMRNQHRVVTHAVQLGCDPVTPAQARRRLRRLLSPPPARALTGTGQRLTQPDRRSCGAATVVVARAAEAGTPAPAMTPEGFAEQVLAEHRLLTAPRDAHGRWQPPWPRLLGTPPWAVARRMTTSATAYRLRPVLPSIGSRGRAWRALGTATAPVPLYVGSRGLPRHVCLVLHADDLRAEVYEPSQGVVLTVTRDQFLRGDLPLGWPVPWLLVAPTRRITVTG